MTEPGQDIQTATPAEETAAAAPVAAPRLKAINEPHSTRRVKRIAAENNGKSYLEIGVFNGKTFNNVTFDHKVAVDPHFGFSLEEHAGPGVEFVKKTSDAYFCEREEQELFDVIFLDGLHTFQQTLRDFNNTLAVCSHAKTVWLIDDVLPSDVFSALPIAAEARQFRRDYGNPSNAWHGDVYKTIFAIHDFFPSLSYVTLTTSGNPQAIVWKKARKNFKPLFNSVEAIERLSYFDFKKNEQIFNEMKEPEALEYFAASFHGKADEPSVVSVA